MIEITIFRRPGEYPRTHPDVRPRDDFSFANPGLPLSGHLLGDIGVQPRPPRWQYHLTSTLT